MDTDGRVLHKVFGIRVGLLLNFAKPKLKFERFVV
jgi:hypothetical protein